jgi:serine palmitoyltransferase
LVEDWTPEPLVAKVTPFEEAQIEKGPVIVGYGYGLCPPPCLRFLIMTNVFFSSFIWSSPTGPRSKLSNGRTVTNLGSYNFYNLVSNELLKERAIQTLRTYGVGPCGPPGFYGTQDVHMKIEADMAAFLGTTACIIYAQAFSTISSVIPAFSKRGDIIVADKAVNYSIRKGLQISRSTVRWYEHNDMEDLQRVLAKVTKEQSKKALTRRFIVTEGLFENVGDMVDLVKIIELKQRFKFRLILDETWSFGVLGRTGRGVTEHQHVDAAEVDMIVGSMAGPLCAAGGFCAGSDEIVEHQRLSAASYTFSAALPAMSATTASETLLILQSQPDLLTGLRENIKAMWAQLDPRSDWMRCMSAVENPIMLMVLKQDVVNSRRLGADEQQQLLQEIVDEVSIASSPPRSLDIFSCSFLSLSVLHSNP